MKKEIEDLIKPIIQKAGYKLVKFEIVSSRGGKKLIVTVSKKGRMGIEDCVKVSKLIDKKIEQSNLIKTRYFLIVSSPGI